VTSGVYSAEIRRATMPPPNGNWCDSIRNRDERGTQIRAGIYGTNSLGTTECKNGPPQLLTGGLLVRVQPEEPFFRLFGDNLGTIRQRIETDSVS
jgi:hypothetical protein